MFYQKHISSAWRCALYYKQRKHTTTLWRNDSTLNISLSLNRHRVTEIFEFANEIRELEIANGDILVSYDVSSLFANVPLNETIEILANRAFTNNWFNSTYDLNLTETDLVDLLSVAAKGQLFQFNGTLYELMAWLWVHPLVPY